MSQDRGPTLSNRMRALGSQIGADKVLEHSYESFYGQLFQGKINQPLKILEIGVGGENFSSGGQSLILWHELFPNAEIYGLDIYPKTNFGRDRIRTFVIDQFDSGALANFHEEFGPFDLVIDDGSHRRHHVLGSLFTLAPLMRGGSFYVIEDLFTAYWPSYGGSTVLSDFMDTPIRWVKNMIDLVNRDALLSEKPNLPTWEVRNLFASLGLVAIEFGAARRPQAISNRQMLETQKQLDSELYGRFSDFSRSFASDPMAALKLQDSREGD